MQRQKMNLHLVCEFDPGSSSNTSSMDQHNLLLDPVDTENLPNYLLSPGDSTLQHGNARQENPSYDICNSGRSSLKHPINDDHHDQAMMEHVLMHSSSFNLEVGSIIEGAEPEATDFIPLENINLDLGINHIDQGQPSSQLLDLPNNVDNMAMSTQDLGSGSSRLPCHAGLLTSDQILMSDASLSAISSSSAGIGVFSECNRGRQSSEPEGCHSSRKRTVDYLHQNGTRMLPASSLNIPSSSHSTGLHPPIEPVAREIDTITVPLASGHHSSGFPRNTRTRTNPHQNDMSLRNVSLRGGSSSHPRHLPAPQPYNSSIPAYQSDELGLIANISCSNAPPPASPGVLALIRNGSSGIVGEGSTLGLGSMPTRSNPNQMLLVPPNNTNNPVSGSPNRRFTNGAGRIHIGTGSTFRAEDNAGAQQPVGSSFAYRQFPSIQNHRIVSEIVRRSVLSSGTAHSGSRSVSLQQNGSHDQQPYLRQALWADRQNNGLLGIPVSTQIPAARREMRSRMLLEDILVLEQSGFFGSANLHDRHGGMRLDVDNMSYEELLALEERIGNVSTGLSKGAITELLRRRKYISITPLPSEEVEPCCICREEYEEGEELGRLDCGHDFHTACIKQWLVLKNLCPICRTTALGAPKKG